MPKVSGKQKLCKSILNECYFKLTVCEEMEEQNKIIENCMENILVVLSFRYLVPFQLGSVAKSKDWYTRVLPTLDEDRFKSIRVNFLQFDTILAEIIDDPVFNSNHASKQMPVEMQLAIVLYRLGSSGEGATLRKMANVFGCGDGGTINIITKRVLMAILNKKDKFLFWPSETERKHIISKTFDELPHCIGYVDGSEIPLAEKPTWDPDAYYSRKQQFSIKVQVVCDFEMKIRHVISGFPGSVHDQRMFSYSAVSKNVTNFFKGVEWIAGDTAYTLKTYVLTPFKRNSGRQLNTVEKKFNTHFSKYRVRVEHTFAILKERFNSLKQLKLRILDKDSIKTACVWITACCILHNIILPTEEIQELPEIEEDNDDMNDDDIFQEEENIEAINKRKALLELLLEK